MSRIENTFKNADNPCLVTFVTACDPDFDTSLGVLNALVDGGADVIEIGMPFTDPVADGPTIQEASNRALVAGASLLETIRLVKMFRAENKVTPIVLMGYANPIFVYGYDNFCRDAKAAGVDGMIIVDIPPEESDEIKKYAAHYELDFIRLITPTTDAARLKVILKGASGFLYYVSITGVTGSAKADLSQIKPHLDMIKAHTDLPIAIGFGVKTPADAARMGALSDGVVVGSSIVNNIAKGVAGKGMCDKISAQVHDLKMALS